MNRAPRWNHPWFAVAMIALAGCLSTPKNGDTIAAKAAQLDFEGYNPDSPAATITVYALNNSTSQWVQLAHPPIAVDPTPHTDNAGTTWYKFQATDVVLPQDNAYWTQSGGSTLKIKVKARSSNYGDLTTYDVGADACWNQYIGQGGLAIMQHCASPQSPVVTLNVACGAASADCCLQGPTCAYGKNCAAGKCTAACGGLNQACCDAQPRCGTWSTCVNGSCAPCGGTGQACCPGNSCQANNLCTGGSCTHCGGGGEACCAGNTCGAGYLCGGGTCNGAPDLVATSWTTTDLGNGTVQFTVGIKNQGTAPSTYMAYGFTAILDGGSSCYGASWAPNANAIQPGQTVMFVSGAGGGWTKASMVACGGQWKVTVDPSNVNAESNEANNIAFFPNN